ncbi:MAG TPA: ATP-binding protein [Anaerolineae bacterium]|nr:ATP-binding protein [Anaerolineae bacterium]HQK13069.1 ATP-binding protein [Anaerolineae bacterium]
MLVYLRNLRKHPLALLWLFVGVIGMGYVIASLWMQTRLPSDGVLLTEFMASGLRVATRLDPQTPFAYGDEILTVDGLSVWEWGERPWRGGSAPNWRVGQTIVYEVRRNGTLLSLPVTLQPFHTERMLVLRFGVYAMALIGLLVGGYMLLHYPGDPAVRLFFMMAVCLALNLLLHFQVMTLVRPGVFVTEILLKFFTRALLFSALHHFLLIFPISKITSPTIRKWLPLVHIVNPAVSLLVGFVIESSPLQRLMLASQISSWIGLAMLLGGMVSVIHTALTARQPMVLGQIRWVVWGATISILPYLLLTGLPELLLGHALLTIEVTAFFFVALPIAVAVAITRYRLFDVDVLVLQGFVHLIFGLTLGGAYLVLKAITRWILALVISPVHETHVVFVAAVLTTTAFWLLRVPVALYANRLFYRSMADTPQVLEWVIEKLTSAIHLEALTALLTEDLPQKIGVAQGLLWVLNDDGDILVPSADNTAPALPLDEGPLPWLHQGGDPIVRSTPQIWVSSAILDLMNRQNIELALLLQVGERIVGLWGLGPREAHLSYTTTEVRWLQKLTPQIALAVENAQLLQRMQAGQLQLEKEIERRTRIMENDRNRLSAILQNMADALLVTDPSGRIQLVNPAFERLVRLSSRSLMGRRLADIMSLPELETVMTQSLAKPGMVHTADMKLVVPSLSTLNDVTMMELILRASVTTLGDGSAVIFILRDITHEVAVDHMKSEFVSAVSHELRTPLTSVLGFAKLVGRTFDRSIRPVLPVDDEEIRHAVEQIDHNFKIMMAEGEHLTTVLNDVLDISALDAGTLVWNDQPCNLTVLIQDVLAHVRSDLESKGLRLTLEVSSDSLMVLADPVRIKQVLYNLLSNAVKFTERGGITVTARRIPAGMTVQEWDAPAQGAALVAVTDSGSGIAPEELRHLFQRFYQGADMRRGKPKGTGLGLAISHEIVMHYNGKIWAESILGSGSTFSFVLPLM